MHAVISVLMRFKSHNEREFMRFSLLPCFRLGLGCLMMSKDICTSSFTVRVQNRLLIPSITRSRNFSFFTLTRASLLLLIFFTFLSLLRRSECMHTVYSIQLRFGGRRSIPIAIFILRTENRISLIYYDG